MTAQARTRAAEVRKVKFARAVAAGESQTAAAVAAGYSKVCARVKGSKLMRDAVVQGELARAREADAAKWAGVREKALGRLVEALEAKASDYVVVASDGAARIDVKKALKTLDRLVGVKVKPRMMGGEATDEVEIELPDKLAVIDRLAKLLGWNAPEKHEVTQTTEVQAMSDAEVEAWVAAEVARNKGSGGRHADVD